jgi:hypothetical protein
MKILKGVSVSFVFLFFDLPIAKAEVICDETVKAQVATDFVSSRYCGTPFDDLNIVYLANGLHDLMTKLRRPVVAGNFKLTADSMILADRMSLAEKEASDDGAWFIFSYRRLATMEGSSNFPVFVSDVNPKDQFRLFVDKECRVIDPPVARVHPARLYSELERGYFKLQSVLGEKCEELSHCKSLQLQVKFLQDQWPKQINEDCSLEKTRESSAE